MSHLPPPSHLPNNDIEKNNNINNHIDSSSDGNGSPYHLDSHDNSDTGLRKIKTAGSISITPETFESLFLSPKNRVANDLRATFANPTPLYVNELPLPFSMGENVSFLFSFSMTRSAFLL